MRALVLALESLFLISSTTTTCHEMTALRLPSASDLLQPALSYARGHQSKVSRVLPAHFWQRLWKSTRDSRNRSDVFIAMVLLNNRCEKLEQQVAKAIVDAQNRPEREQNKSPGQERLQSRDGQNISAPQWNRERCPAPEAKDLSSNLLKL